MDYFLTNRNFLLLLTVGAVINTRVQGMLFEPKVPTRVTACLGSNPTIKCTISTYIKGLKVKWYFSRTFDFMDQKHIDILSSNGSSVSHYHEARGRNASYLTIKNVTFSDMGWYFCKVTQDIPQLINEHSNGSELVIYSATESNLEYNTTTCGKYSPTGSNLEYNTTIDVLEPPKVLPWWLWVVLAAGCVMIVTTVMITTFKCRRNKESPVYENTKEASKRHCKEDQALHHSMPSKGYTSKQMDTLKPHKYESCPKPSPKYR